MHVLNSMLSVLNLTLPNQQMFNILWNAAKDHKVIEPVVHMPGSWGADHTTFTSLSQGSGEKKAGPDCTAPFADYSPECNTQMYGQH